MKTNRDRLVHRIVALVPALAVACLVAPLSAQTNAVATMTAEQEAELAKQTLNPVAALISVPLQNNWDFGIGPNDAMKYTLNIQPVVPLSISDDWNLIVRTIVPVAELSPVYNGDKRHSGSGDITQSLFFSPKEPWHDWIVGAGPVGLYPSATDPVFGNQQWGAGPTFVVLQQQHGFTYGLLANHIWGFAGWGDQPTVNASFVQPFFSYSTKSYTSFGANTESTYNWQAHEWTVPLNFTVTQLLKIGKLPISLQFGYRYYAQRPAGGPDWGLRASITFLFPKK